jgi:hypothetical protein
MYIEETDANSSGFIRKTNYVTISIIFALGAADGLQF